MKQCRHCGLEKPVDEFYGDRAARDGHRPKCKVCTSARRKAWYAATREREIARVQRWKTENPERARERWERRNKTDAHKLSVRRAYLKRTYGLCIEEYEAMLEAQGGGCALCGRPPTEGISVHVDHEHATGAVRGLLCFPCNNALGDLDDDPGLLRRASDCLARNWPEYAEARSLTLARLAEMPPPAWTSR